MTEEEKTPFTLVDSSGNPLSESTLENDCCGECSKECNAGCSDNVHLEEESVEDEAMQQEAMEAMFIKHPFSDSFMPMAVVEVGLKSYICGLSEFDPVSGWCVVCNPMMFQEHLTENGGLKLAMRIPYMCLGCIDNLQLQYDSLYLLQNSRPDDMRVASSYEDNYTKVRLGQSNIVAPTAEEMMQIHRG